MTSQRYASAGACLTLTMLWFVTMRGGYIVQRHNEIRDVEAENLQVVYFNFKFQLLFLEQMTILSTEKTGPQTALLVLAEKSS